MHTQTFVKIATPCKANWDQMDSNNIGKFCGSCKKTVVDFSVMTDEQILAFINKAASNTCGRFSADQLERSLIPNKKQIKKNWQWLFAAITGLLFSSEKIWATNISKQINHQGIVNLMKQQALTDTILTPALQCEEKINQEVFVNPDHGPTIMGKLEIFGKLDIKSNIVAAAKEFIQQPLFKATINQQSFTIQSRQKGEFHLQLYNANSRLLMQHMVTITQTKTPIRLVIADAMPEGNYYVRMMNVADKKESIQKISL